MFGPCYSQYASVVQPSVISSFFRIHCYIRVLVLLIMFIHSSFIFLCWIRTEKHGFVFYSILRTPTKMEKKMRRWTAFQLCLIIFTLLNVYAIMFVHNSIRYISKGHLICNNYILKVYLKFKDKRPTTFSVSQYRIIIFFLISFYPTTYIRFHWYKHQ